MCSLSLSLCNKISITETKFLVFLEFFYRENFMICLCSWDFVMKSSLPVSNMGSFDWILSYFTSTPNYLIINIYHFSWSSVIIHFLYVFIRDNLIFNFVVSANYTVYGCLLILIMFTNWIQCKYVDTVDHMKLQASFFKSFLFSEYLSAFCAFFSGYQLLSLCNLCFSSHLPCVIAYLLWS